MSFFKDFKDDLSQAVDELMPGDELMEDDELDDDSDVMMVEALPLSLAQARAHQVPSGSESARLEVRGDIVACFDSKTTRRNSQDVFRMSCELMDGHERLIVAVSSPLLEQLIGTSPTDWRGLDDNEKSQRFRRCGERLKNIKPPHTLIHHGTARDRDEEFELIAKSNV